VESSCECGNEPSDAINCWETVELRHSGLLSSAQLHRVSFMCNVFFVFSVLHMVCVALRDVFF
jgi:hypothetical protein